MKIGLLGLIWSDWSDVTYEKLRFAAELGFHGVGAHLTVPVETVSDTTAANVRAIFDDQNMPLLQIWAPHGTIISPDEAVRKAGIKDAKEIVKLAARMGVSECGARPTSLNPRGDWWPHPDNYKPETEDRLVESLKEIVSVAEGEGVDVVLETHVTTTLNSAKSIKRVMDRVGSDHLKVNLDTVNFVGDFPSAYDPAPMINEMFDLLSDRIATVHVKDFYMEDRFVIHISETVVGTGMMDMDTVLRRSYEANPDGYVVIEHLPVDLIPLAKRNLTTKINELGIPLEFCPAKSRDNSRRQKRV